MALPSGKPPPNLPTRETNLALALCPARGYGLQVISRFRHKGLERFYNTGHTGGINPQHAAKLRRLLTALDISAVPADMDVPGGKLHPLHGDRKGEWAVWVSGNWRLVFSFIDGAATNIDYVDYH